MRGFLIALTFLTRLPLPAPGQVTKEEFSRSQYYYPLVGLVVGLVLWLLNRLLFPYFSPLVTGAVLLGAGIILTGGIHLDGFMDSMDGLLSARSPERMLEIMKDSHVGAHATISVVSLLLLKFALLASIDPSMGYLLLITPVISRWAFQIGVIWFPYARAEGLGQGFHEAAHKLIFLVEGLIILGLALYLLGLGGLIVFLAAIIFVLLFSWRISALLGGLTGDLYGAAIELTEVIVLLLALPFLA